MDERQSAGSADGVVILLSQLAEFDLSDIHTYTTHQHGLPQADDYIRFLTAVMKTAAQDPGLGRPVAERPGRWMILAKWKRARAGHNIIFERLPDGIYVIRILHTSMNLLDHIGME